MTVRNTLALYCHMVMNRACAWSKVNHAQAVSVPIERLVNPLVHNESGAARARFFNLKEP